ncbi:MAG TPA: Rieske (2Fe-2S) protein [Pyrinomonadaceae bacterium]|nr:Rieske (2Fe-2S) protein [Pyrinomonadaceae bacterium]
MLWIPAAVFASLGATMFAAAYRFLRPRAGEVGVAGGGDAWVAAADAGEVGRAAAPLRREVVVEHRAGWATAPRAHAVFVLPGREGRVVSAVCPHEGCEVFWEEGRGQFLCPCHDSSFDAAGARLSGPARAGLVEIPSRVSGGRLEVRADAVASLSEESEAAQRRKGS